MQLYRSPEEPGKVLVRLTPPQTATMAAAKPTKGAYCFVVDVSGSMQSAADVKNDDGDKVSLGFCLLDIAKHATNTFITSLEADDYVAVVTYGSNAALCLDWTKCDDAGRARAIEKVNAMTIMGSTNLVAGVEHGFARFEQLPVPPAELPGYAQQLVIATDGQPDQRMDYAPLVAKCQEQLVTKRDHPAARVNVTTIGLGNSLDSELLLGASPPSTHPSVPVPAPPPPLTTPHHPSPIPFPRLASPRAGMADQFLHMPDPGAVGPFMVNLLANTRCTAVVDGVAANRATLVVRPASALPAPPKPSLMRRASSSLRGSPERRSSAASQRDSSRADDDAAANGASASAPRRMPSAGDAPRDALLGWPAGAVDGASDTWRIPIGMVGYDQPRHFVLHTLERAAVTVSLELNGVAVASASLAQSQAALPADAPLLIEAETLRSAAVAALVEAAARPEAPSGSTGGGGAQGGGGANEAPIEAILRRIEASPAKALPAVEALATTLRDECLLGMSTAENRRTWGRHYCHTLPGMLRTERRSNFRDAALQHLGRDASGNDGLFAEQSDAAELAFATLAPPTPSLAARRNSATYAPPAALPAEYMRGGGCFAPDATVDVVGVGPTRLDALRAGARVRTADGGDAAVRCVVLTPCAGGRAVLVTLPRSLGGLRLTEWHPVLCTADSDGGRFRFPLMLGAAALHACEHVYNLVLDRCHVPLVCGVGAVSLGHGLESDDVVRHAYWGGAVLDDLAKLDGWAEGRVVLRAAKPTAAAAEPEPAASAASAAVAPPVAVAAF